MAEQVQWRIVAKHTPAVLRRCPRCDVRRPFICSDKFRINGSGRKLDVWLIYKCEHCNSTWNSTILTRVSPESIDKTLYQNFLDNDLDTAWRYAFDFEILKRNQAEVDPNVELEIEGPTFDLQKDPEKSLQIAIDPGYVTVARLDTMLAQRLNLPRKKLHALFESGAAKVEPKVEIDRKLKRPVLVTIDLRAARDST